MAQDGRTAEGTVAEFEAWWSANPGEGLIEGTEAAAALMDLFVRSARVGADLHDPTAELLRWLTRDLARDEDVDVDTYEAAILTIPRFLLFLRAHRMWRRSERAVQDCWDVTDWATQRPLGLPTLGTTIDETIAGRLAQVPGLDELRATRDLGMAQPFVTPLRAVLDAVAQEPLTPDAVASLTGWAPGSAAYQLFVDGLDIASLVREGPDTGVLTAGGDVRDAQGCPPPSSALVTKLVLSWARAALARSFEDDIDADQMSFPRGISTALALIAATDESFMLAQDDDDSEDDTASIVTMFVGESLGEDDPRVPAFADEAIARLRALADLGVLERTPLPRGGEGLLAPEPFRYAVMRAVADYVGCVGTEDTAIDWATPELSDPRSPDTVVDLTISLEQDPGVWRRVRAAAHLPLPVLQRMITSSFGWRGLRRHSYHAADGTPRFAPAWMLRSLNDDEHLDVIAAEGVQLGRLLGTTGDEALFRYGHDANPWSVRVRVERVMTGVKEPVTWMDAGGTAPPEPTFFEERLAEQTPPAITVPPGLDAGWAFMEAQGWMTTSDDGDEMLAPGPPVGGVPGALFRTGLSLDGLVPEGPARERLLPLAVADETGGLLALWADDDGVTHVVLLGTSGEAYRIADSGYELLALLAVGYHEISVRTLGGPATNERTVELTAELRGWLQQRVGLHVPDRWPGVGPDAFTAWVAQQRGGEPVQPRPVPPPDLHVTGEVRLALSVLGRRDRGAEAQALAGMIGVALVDGELRRSGAALAERGVEVEVVDGVVTTIWIQPARGYPHPDGLIDGLPAASPREQVLATLGEPEASGPEWVRYVVDDRYLHLHVGDAGLDLVTLMLEVP